MQSNRIPASERLSYGELVTAAAFPQPHDLYAPLSASSGIGHVQIQLEAEGMRGYGAGVSSGPSVRAGRYGVIEQDAHESQTLSSQLCPSHVVHVELPHNRSPSGLQVLCYATFVILTILRVSGRCIVVREYVYLRREGEASREKVYRWWWFE